MKNGKNPTRKQQEAMIKAGLNPAEWLVVKNTGGLLTIEYRAIGNVMTIPSDGSKNLTNC